MYRCHVCRAVKPAEEMELRWMYVCLACENARVLVAQRRFMAANPDYNRAAIEYQATRRAVLRRFGTCNACGTSMRGAVMRDRGLIRPKTVEGRRLASGKRMKDIVNLPWETLYAHFKALCPEDALLEERNG